MYAGCLGATGHSRAVTTSTLITPRHTASGVVATATWRHWMRPVQTLTLISVDNSPRMVDHCMGPSWRILLLTRGNSAWMHSMSKSLALIPFSFVSFFFSLFFFSETNKFSFLCSWHGTYTRPGWRFVVFVKLYPCFIFYVFLFYFVPCFCFSNHTNLDNICMARWVGRQTSTFLYEQTRRASFPVFSFFCLT